jgi:hypothetical protein
MSRDTHVTDSGLYNPLVVFDSMRKNDLFIVEEMILPAYPNTFIVPVPHAGHKVLVTLQRAGILKNS